MNKVVPKNCSKCPDFKENKCNTETYDCLCKRCPRNIGECLTIRYCRETESAII